jgi:hypothetical protein
MKGETSNIEHRTLNAEVIVVRCGHSMFSVRCSMFDVPDEEHHYEVFGLPTDVPFTTI